MPKKGPDARNDGTFHANEDRIYDRGRCTICVLSCRTREMSSGLNETLVIFTWVDSLQAPRYANCSFRRACPFARTHLDHWLIITYQGALLASVLLDSRLALNRYMNGSAAWAEHQETACPSALLHEFTIRLVPTSLRFGLVWVAPSNAMYPMGTSMLDSLSSAADRPPQCVTQHMSSLTQCDKCNTIWLVQQNVGCPLGLGQPNSHE